MLLQAITVCFICCCCTAVLLLVKLPLAALSVACTVVTSKANQHHSKGCERYFAYVREAQYQQQQQSQSCLTHVTLMCHDMPGLAIMPGRLGDRFACSLRAMLTMDHRLGVRFLGRCSASNQVLRHGGWTIPLYPQKYTRSIYSSKCITRL